MKGSLHINLYYTKITHVHTRMALHQCLPSLDQRLPGTFVSKIKQEYKTRETLLNVATTTFRGVFLFLSVETKKDVFLNCITQILHIVDARDNRLIFFPHFF